MIHSIDFLLESSDSFAMLLTYDHEQVIVNRMNPVTCAGLRTTEEKAIGRTFSSLFQNEQPDLDVFLLLVRICTEKKKVCQFSDAHFYLEDRMLNLTYTLTPIVHEDTTYILVVAQSYFYLPYKYHSKAELEDCIHSFFDVSTIPMALLELSDDFSYRLIQSNEQVPILFEQIPTAYLLDRARALISSGAEFEPYGRPQSSPLYDAQYEFYLLRLYVPTDDWFLLLYPHRRPRHDSTSLLFSKLSPREKQILLHASYGESNKAIAVFLQISEGTVKKILYNAYSKLHVCSRSEATRLIISNSADFLYGGL